MGTPLLGGPCGVQGQGQETCSDGVPLPDDRPFDDVWSWFRELASWVLSRSNRLLPFLPRLRRVIAAHASRCLTRDARTFPPPPFQLVLPGAALDGKSLYELIESEKVTVSAGVPTVWLGLLNHVRSAGKRFSTMTRTVVGGAACPPAMLREFVEGYNVEVRESFLFCMRHQVISSIMGGHRRYMV
jgi:hypothetical protein